MLKVVHIKDSLKTPGYKSLYIGRGQTRDNRMENAYLGNPFKLNPNETRGSTLQKFKQWAWKEYNTNKTYKDKLDTIAERIINGENIELVCFCKPNPCHGDILKDFIEWIIKQKQQNK